MATITPVLTITDALQQMVRDGAAPPPALTHPKRSYQDGEISPSAPPGYYLFGGVSEEPGLYYNRPGTQGRYMVHGWGAGRREALELYAWFLALVDGRPLPLIGHTLEVASVVLLGLPAGPDGKSHQAEMEVTVRSQFG